MSIEGGNYSLDIRSTAQSFAFIAHATYRSVLLVIHSLHHGPSVISTTYILLYATCTLPRLSETYISVLHTMTQ
jgi:hypothetical protein